MVEESPCFVERGEPGLSWGGPWALRKLFICMSYTAAREFVLSSRMQLFYQGFQVDLYH